ncbi:MAG: hypothetical protein ACE5F1_16520 [Planctomycetota bacterium]
MASNRPCRSVRMLALLVGLALPVPGPAQTGAEPDRLSTSFERWFRTFRKGRLGPDSSGWERQSPYLHPALRDELTEGVYSRLQESLDLFRLLRERGRYADGQRLIRVLATSWKENPTLLGWLKTQVLEQLEGPSCPSSIQAAVFDRIQAGFEEARRPGGRHPEPELAAQLIPLLGSFPRFRLKLESYCRSEHASLGIAAARGLMRMGSHGSTPVVARLLSRVEGVEQMREAVRIVLGLHEFRSLGKTAPDKASRGKAATRQDRRDVDAREGDGGYLLDIALERLERSESPGIKQALLPLLLRVRAKRSVPVLIAELEKARARYRSGRAPTDLPFWMGVLHEALLNLTGFYAPLHRADKWRAFWEREKDRFRVAPARSAKSRGSTASAFFGIPVRGRRVLFLLDTSGSMAAPMRATGLAAFAPAKTRLEKAKEELLRAVSGLDKEAEFNVLLFATDTRRWLRAPRSKTPYRYGLLQRFLGRARPNGGTGLLGALRQGLEGKVFATQTRTRRSVDEVFVLSDGAPSSSPQGILDAVKEWNKGRVARIHAIYLGGGASFGPKTGFGPASFMRRLAAENNGVFRSVE